MLCDAKCCIAGALSSVTAKVEELTKEREDTSQANASVVKQLKQALASVSTLERENALLVQARESLETQLTSLKDYMANDEEVRKQELQHERKEWQQKVALEKQQTKSQVALVKEGDERIVKLEEALERLRGELLKEQTERVRAETVLHNQSVVAERHSEERTRVDGHLRELKADMKSKDEAYNAKRAEMQERLLELRVRPAKAVLLTSLTMCANAETSGGT